MQLPFTKPKGLSTKLPSSYLFIFIFLFGEAKSFHYYIVLFIQLVGILVILMYHPEKANLFGVKVNVQKTLMGQSIRFLCITCGGGIFVEGLFTYKG